MTEAERELRCGAPAAVDGVERRPQALHGVVEEVLAGRLVGGLQQRSAGSRATICLALRADVLALLAPTPSATPPSTCGQAGMPPRWHGREVRAREERDLLGRDEDVQRPAALAGHRLDGLHVDRVDVGALLAIDLHADEVLVHERRDLLVLEALALHDVAPVARRVADRDEQRAVELARAGQRLLAPGQPVDRVVAVLQEVRRGLAGERVGHAPDGTRRLRSRRLACVAQLEAAQELAVVRARQPSQRRTRPGRRG